MTRNETEYLVNLAADGPPQIAVLGGIVLAQQAQIDRLTMLAEVLYEHHPELAHALQAARDANAKPLWRTLDVTLPRIGGDRQSFIDGWVAAHLYGDPSEAQINSIRASATRAWEAR